MAERGQRIFRTKALERISSPERVDELMQIVSPKDWLPLVVLSSLILLALVWSVAGRVPTAVTAPGILTHPHRVLDLQTLGGGRIEMLRIKPGDVVQRGDVIARLDQVDLRKRLDEDRAQLLALQAQDRAQDSMEAERLQLQRRETQLQRIFVASQATYLRKILADAETMEPLLQRRLNGLRHLRTEGLVADGSADLIQAEQAVVESRARLTDATARLKQLDLDLQQFEAREAIVRRENLGADTARRNQMREIESRIAVDELQLQRHSAIHTGYSGRIFEVFVADGQIVPSGTRLATVVLDASGNELMSVSYFTVRDGKKIQPGMRVLVTPDPVERHRFGGITGFVKSVSSLPVTPEGSRGLVGNASVVETLMQGGPRIEVVAELHRDAASADGYRWSSSRGPSLEVGPGTTTTVRVTVETRAPISYVLPFLREITGIY